MMESQLMKLAIETYKITLMISLPGITSGLSGGAISEYFSSDHSNQ